MGSKFRYCYKRLDCKMNTTHQQRQQTRLYTCGNRCFDSQDSNLLPTLSIGFLTFNTVVALFRAHSHGDLTMMAFVLFFYLGFMSLFCCLKAIDRLPIYEESPKKERLKVAVWLLSAALNLGLAIRFAPLLHPVASVFIFAMATASSGCSFYFMFIFGDDSSSSTSSGDCCSEKKYIRSFTFSPSAEKVGDKNIEPFEHTSLLVDV